MANQYVDQSASNNGDGTSYVQAPAPGGVGAFNTFKTNFGAGNNVWIRRTSKAYTSSITQLNDAATKYIGWPKPGDDHYSSRPVAAQAAWDGDVADYAEATFASSYTHYMQMNGSGGAEYHRLRGYNSVTSGGTSMGIYISIASIVAKYCEGQADMSASTTEGRGIYVHAANVGLFGCTGTARSNSTVGGGIKFSSSSDGSFAYDCEGIKTAGQAAGIYIDEDVMLVRCKGVGTIGYGIHATAATTPSDASLIDCEAVSTDNFAFYVDTHLRAVINMDCSAGGGFKIAANATIGICTFKRINQTVSGLNAGIEVLTDYLPYVYAQNVSFSAGNTVADIVTDKNTRIVLRNAVFASATSVSGDDHQGIFSSDHNGVKGAWKTWQSRGEAELQTGVSRTGGHSGSIKMLNDVATAPLIEPLLEIGTQGMETVILPLKAGSNTITVYGAMKSYTADPTQDELFFELDYLNNGGDVNREQETTRDPDGAALTADASVWTGDSGLTGFKLTMTITVGQDCLAPLRITLNKQDNAGYLYIDPLAEVA
ncbi:MAG: hypothetical protein DRQ46_00170 [Gammaproteobacteria bacterium]|nr:MAG: hypothetical protein DRQ46_00170 [Gammaproteobacteria bacterium]